MKKTKSLSLIILAAALFVSPVSASEKPVKHLEIADITSKEEATKVLAETTKQLKAKTKLDSVELGEIHVITYSLEKAVAYFAGNGGDEQKQAAKQMAEVVEMIHLGSENNRVEETKQNLDKYFDLADGFSAELLASQNLSN